MRWFESEKPCAIDVLPVVVSLRPTWRDWLIQRLWKGTTPSFRIILYLCVGRSPYRSLTLRSEFLEAWLALTGVDCRKRIDFDTSKPMVSANHASIICLQKDIRNVALHLTFRRSILNSWLTDWKAGWRSGKLTNLVTDWLTVWLSRCLASWLSA